MAHPSLSVPVVALEITESPVSGHHVLHDSPASVRKGLSARGAHDPDATTDSGDAPNDIDGDKDGNDSAANEHPPTSPVNGVIVNNEPGAGGPSAGHEDEDSDVSSDEEDDEDEEDEDEPTLKYERLGGDVDLILHRDSASTLAVCSKYLVRLSMYGLNPKGCSFMFVQAIGTHAGIVHVLELRGTRVKSFKPHSASIVDLCLDEGGEFFATASLDGQCAPYFDS
jgi:vacuolar protein sorting-associated protein 41